MAFRIGSIFKSRTPEEPPKVRYLISAAGVPNYGDEFITRAWLREVARLEPQSEVWLDCISPSHAALLFAGDHPNLHFTSTVWSMVWKANEDFKTLEEGRERVCAWTHHLGSPREDLGILKMKTAASIHLLGGGYLNQVWPQHGMILDIVRSAKEDAGMPLWCTGLGVAPCDGAWLDNLKSSIEMFDFVDVRDDESARILGVERGVDDAFLVAGDPQAQWTSVRDDMRVFISLQDDVVGQHPEAADNVVRALLESGVAEDERIALVEAIPPDDGWPLELMRQRWNGEVAFIPFLDLWNGGFPVAEDAIWVSSRFHMHLLGAASGAKGIYLDFGSGYYDVKHASLARLGTGWTRFSPLEDDVEGIRASCDPQFKEYAKELARQKHREAAKLYRS